MPKKLLTGERQLLVFYIMNPHLRQQILADARKYARTSGSLIQAYEWALDL